MDFLIRKEILHDKNIISVEFGGKKADFIGKNSLQQEVIIEVKATGRHNFVTFTEKDKRADYIVWLDFGELFENNSSSEIKVYIFQPKLDALQASEKDRKEKIDLNRLRKMLKNQTLQETILDLNKYGFC